MPQCSTCMRHRPDMPTDPERRPHTVVIDASIATIGGVCLMREAIQ